nr:hypothetical protein [Tanacetum cinerariifolium]
MDKVDHISPLVELEVEVEMIEDVGFDKEEYQVLEKVEADEEEEDVYKVLVLHPKVTTVETR